MEKKVTTFEVKQFDADSRLMSGYASTFGMPADLTGDVIVKGAFAESVIKIKAEGIPLLDTHDAKCGDVLGTVIDALEDDHGLWITAKLADTPGVEECRQKMQQGHLNKMSIGFFTLAQTFRQHNGEELRFIEKADLVEISVVAIPANPRANIVSVKNQETDVDAEPKQVTESATDVTTPKKVNVPSADIKNLSDIAELLIQSLNNTRSKYDGQ